ncbi:uncharacterized protein BJ212DRAFT_1306063 [Suillus subaureus]|uniref:Uncharacterized protein n=1 Tax=Suillus subaureus TaxID=48587 RepID=A0A9P7IYT1_9AGAM|nr:uncharacterized protein BJ212DRAFT_1306063 [Suillus subaureus]KAG1797211.1 hypothetical protein BJ212DRAFT_1306063 [Suillus subaureus]
MYNWNSAELRLWELTRATGGGCRTQAEDNGGAWMVGRMNKTQTLVVAKDVRLREWIGTATSGYVEVVLEPDYLTRTKRSTAAWLWHLSGIVQLWLSVELRL